jgi:hypothetical protein
MAVVGGGGGNVEVASCDLVPLAVPPAPGRFLGVTEHDRFLAVAKSYNSFRGLCSGTVGRAVSVVVHGVVTCLVVTGRG